MAGDMKKFHESMKDLKTKIEKYIELYGNSMGTIDKNNFDLILGDTPRFEQDYVSICRIIAWNVQMNQNTPELDEETVNWANAMRVFRHAPDAPDVYELKLSDLRYLNAIAHLAMTYMQRESAVRQASSYKTLEDLKKYASDFEASRQFRKPEK